MINAINALSNYPAYTSTVKPGHKELDFKGLDKRFKKEVYVSSKHLEALYGVYPKSGNCVGQLPVEIINEIKANTPANEISAKIKQVRQAFADSAEILKKADSKKQLIDIDTLFRKYLDLKLEGKDEDLLKLESELSFNEYNPEGFMEKLEQDASSSLTEGFRNAGILGENESAVVKYLDYGKYGRAYSIEFKDSDDKQKFSSYVLKVYKDPKEADESHTNFRRKVMKYTDSNKYIELIKEYMKKYGSNVSEVIFHSSFALMRNYGLTNEEYNVLKNYHGIYAEANAAKFLEAEQHNAMDDTDLIRTYFFDLTTGFALVKLADDKLPDVKKHVRLNHFGLVNKDTKEDNLAYARLIDYGAIVTDTQTKAGGKDLSTLASNRRARKIYKDIARVAEKSPDEARKLREKLYNEARNNKIPQSKDVIIGLDLTKSFLD